MIVMVTCGGKDYTAAAGLNITVPGIEKITTSTGKMAAAMVVSSCGFYPYVQSVTGAIANIRLVTASGCIDDGGGATNLTGVQFCLIADGV